MVFGSVVSAVVCLLLAVACFLEKITISLRNLIWYYIDLMETGCAEKNEERSSQHGGSFP